MKFDQPLTVIDLFCGAGGLSYGFIGAGFSVLAAIDNNRTALQTYKVNLGPHVLHWNLADDVVLPDAAVIIGEATLSGFFFGGPA